MTKLTKTLDTLLGSVSVNDLSAYPGNVNDITEMLLRRMENEKIYTWVGPLLLALNPDRQVSGLYDETQRMSFAGNPSRPKDPHIYAVANRARYRLLNDLGKIRQVIVISGESGTGKTFNARKALEFLALTSIPLSRTSGTTAVTKSCDEIVRKIANVFPLISAFSTARTAKNSKSSRHGQLLRLEYDKPRGALRGCRVDSFLLERTRVTACSDNFDIFYQLLHGLTEREMNELLLSRSDNYSILGNCQTRDESLFVHEFRETVDSLEALGFTDVSRSDIFRVIAFLLHFGNIRFRKKSREGCAIDLIDEGSSKALKNVCSLVSLPEWELTELLTSTLICPRSSERRHTSYRRQLKTPEDCRNRLFSIARYIYDRLFNWIVDRVNEKLTTTEKHPDWLGILDIFGFESFEFNGLEQLSINYATEILQLHFVEDYLQAGQTELSEEGLEDWEESSPSSTIKLYEDRLTVIEHSVFRTFNDACQSPIARRFSSWCNRLLQDKDHRFLKITYNGFVIEHYSCPVEYNADDLLSKNADKVPTELSSTFGNCKSQLLRLLTLTDDENSSGSRSSLKKSTAFGKLERSLDCLLKELRMCDSHYVRCARPRRSNDSWERKEFREQLSGTGIFDALPLTKCKLPVKFQYDDFCKRYLIKPGCKFSKKSERPLDKWTTNSILFERDSYSSLLSRLSDILNIKDLSTSVHLGKYSIFLTEEIFLNLENHRNDQRSRCAEKIQKFWLKNRKKRREKESLILAGKMGEETSSACKAKKLNLSEDQKNSDSPKELEETDNASDFSNNHSREESRMNRRFSDKNTWKRVNVLRWLNGNSVDLSKSEKSRSTSRWEFSREDADECSGSMKIVNKYPLFYRNGILSRRRPVEIPVRFHTRLTCLPYSHCLPSSLRPRGLEDCLLDTVKMIVDY